MKLAVVCDDLIQFGGQERIVEAVLDIYPDAELYTSVVSKKWSERLSDKGTKYYVSFMQKLPFIEKLYRYYSPLFFHVLAFESFDFSEYDKVVSISSRYAHHIITKPTTKHICYMNTPGRMFWESLDYFEDEEYGWLKPIKKLAKPILSMPLNYIRMIDFAAAQRVDYFIANSETPKERIKKYYGRDSTIIYPFIDIEKYKNIEPVIGDYFVVLTRLSSWKKVDIAIKACQRLGTELKIIGEGPDLKRLRIIASDEKGEPDPLIQFMGYISDAQKIGILRNSKALIVTQHEDFGIAPLEAMACGKPVIAYKKGGVLETVTENVTGIFYDVQTTESLMNSIRSFEDLSFEQEKCRKQAEKFGKNVFIKHFKEFIDKC